jgi:hypothetical protein
VFHFLTEPAARARYVEVARRALAPGGQIVIATFGPQGPDRCSGLPVLRFTPGALRAELGDAFEPIADATEIHVTPRGAEQQFVYCHGRLRA